MVKHSFHQENTFFRNPSIELLRIVAMLLITAHHFAIHGSYEFSGTSLNSVTVSVLALGGKLGVNVFILIMGYFFSSSEFSIAKAGRLLGLTTFYSVVTAVAGVIVGTAEFKKSLIVRALLPYLFGSGYWFIVIYIELYVLSIILKKGLEKTTNKQLGFIVGFFLMLFTILPYSAGQLIQLNEFGYSNLVWFIVVYFVGAFIGMNHEFLAKKKALWQILLISCSAVMISARVLDNLYSPGSETVSRAIGRILHVLGDRNLQSPMPVAISALLLIVFSNFTLKPKKWIFTLGSATFGVYLIHDSPWLRSFLWRKICKTTDMADSKYFIPYAIGCILAVFLVCSLIEICRRKIVKSAPVSGLIGAIVRRFSNKGK